MKYKVLTNLDEKYDYDFSIEFENKTKVWITEGRITEINDDLDLEMIKVILTEILDESRGIIDIDYNTARKMCNYGIDVCVRFFYEGDRNEPIELMMIGVTSPIKETEEHKFLTTYGSHVVEGKDSFTFQDLCKPVYQVTDTKLRSFRKRKNQSSLSIDVQQSISEKLKKNKYEETPREFTGCEVLNELNFGSSLIYDREEILQIERNNNVNRAYDLKNPKTKAINLLKELNE